MITITRKLELDAAHRLMGHEGKCKNIHGHRYVVEVTAAAQELDKLGRVIDFSVLKRKLGGWLEENWDHKAILQMSDPLVPALLALSQPVYTTPWPPTGENLAAFLLNLSRVLFAFDGIEVVKIRLWETPNCWVEAT
jgi:6-pyruvoyltetrahydropterin/6-carboxytetrahydropterin synthase